MKSLMLIAICLVCTAPTVAIADDSKRGMVTHPVESQVVEAVKESVVTTRYELVRHPKDEAALPDHLEPETVIQFTPEPETDASQIHYPFLLIKQQEK